MTAPVVIAGLAAPDEAVEVVERKGLGHPDTICDALAETLSRDLRRACLERFGEIRHYNVDKALLWAGQSAPAFGGGRVIKPMEIYLAGRASVGGGRPALALAEIARDGARRWLRQNLRALDVDRHVRIHPLLRPGSQALRGLFGRDRLLSNDTSIGVGYAPLSRLEQLVLAVDAAMARRRREDPAIAWGEDLKIMGVRQGGAVELTIACATIDASLRGPDDYFAQTAAIEALAQAEAARAGIERCKVRVNAADRPEAGELYLTVTGTSAESGDDGQVGRGNRVNGLITPGRPMSLEAAAGKNPATHVGRLYNLACRDIAHRIVTRIAEVSHAQCLMVSRIGSPVDEPALVQVKLATPPGAPAGVFRAPVEQIVQARLSELVQRPGEDAEDGPAVF
jgi:S-adenosylmethionine synthetase